MVKHSSSSRAESSPAISPSVIRFLGIGHILFAIVTFAYAAINGAVEDGSVQNSVMKTLQAVDTPQSLAIKNRLHRTSEVYAGLNKNLTSRLPSRTWVNQLSQTINIAVALLALGAGACLLQKNPLGRSLALAFAGVCLLQKLAMMAYLIFGEIPLAKKYFESLIRLYPSETELLNGIQGPITNGPVYLFVAAIFPAIVLAIMIRPESKSVLTGATIDADREPAIEPAQLAALQLSVLPPVEDDALAELMKRKTF